MITAARLPAPTLNMVASLLTKSFSCLYCGALILRDESITNTTSKSSSHFRSGSVMVGVVIAVLIEEGVVVGCGFVATVVVLVAVVAITIGGGDGSCQTE